MTATPLRTRWLWTWGGISFGYREGDELWTHAGRHVGHFRGNEAYDPNGGYLGEIRSGVRLIIDARKQAQRQLPFFPLPPRPGASRHAPSTALPLPADHRDFSSP
jgi:hypothetical protein